MPGATSEDDLLAVPEVAASAAARAGLQLRQTTAGLELAIPGGSGVSAAASLLHRPRPGRDLLWRAVLAGKGSVVDATAGLGADAFHLAAKGAQVTMIERSPVLAELLRDALEHARAGSLGERAANAASRLSLIVADAVDVLGNGLGSEVGAV
ncbi:MAG TPA: class I SAM-dependent methyltransferase, partial [Trueperaceae bacterium]|nr:class I SAM-dependent methyltransferase [Trueperaceae bacterium]